MFFIGDIRRFFLISGTHRWNAWVRDVTARLENTRLLRSTR